LVSLAIGDWLIDNWPSSIRIPGLAIDNRQSANRQSTIRQSSICNLQSTMTPSPITPELPGWAIEMGDLFRS
jgi:hypothetical protein